MRLRLLDRASDVAPTREERDWRTLATYGTAAVVYVGIGVWWTDFLLSVFVAAAYLILAAWLVPALIGRLR